MLTVPHVVLELLVATDFRQLAGVAHAMDNGDINTSVPLQRADEIGELAKSF